MEFAQAPNSLYLPSPYLNPNVPIGGAGEYLADVPQYPVVIADGINGDNHALALAAANTYLGEGSTIRFAAMIVSGTAVGRPGDPLGSRRGPLSHRAHVSNTGRIAGLFKRAAINVPVFRGLEVARGDITTTIPHENHPTYLQYDERKDGRAHHQGRDAIRGDFNDAMTYIAGLNGIIHFVLGGPLSEIPHLMAHPGIAPKIGHFAAQGSFTPSTRTIYSQPSFNTAVDMKAALHTLINLERPQFYVTPDTTRNPDSTYTGPEELGNIHDELLQIIIAHRALAGSRHKAQEATGQLERPYPPFSPHDVQALMALSQELGTGEQIFTFERLDLDETFARLIWESNREDAKGYTMRVTPDLVRSIGYLGSNMNERGEIPPRYESVAVDSAACKRIIPTLLRPINPPRRFNRRLFV